MDRGNQRHREQEVKENTIDRERKVQETPGRGTLVQEAGDSGNDYTGAWVAGGRKIWKKKREDEQEGWTTVKGRKRQNARKGEHGKIGTANTFSVLESETKEGQKEVGCLIVGDSRVRPLEKNIL